LIEDIHGISNMGFVGVRQKSGIWLMLVNKLTCKGMYIFGKDIGVVDDTARLG
jgi:hypothetical protein